MNVLDNQAAHISQDSIMGNMSYGSTGDVGGGDGYNETDNRDDDGWADCFDVTASVSLSEGFDVGVSADVGCLTDNLMDGSVTTGQGSNSDWGFGDFW